MTDLYSPEDVWHVDSDAATILTETLLDADRPAYEGDEDERRDEQ
ncbi:hypothetical protein [Actinoplanes rectilineatus]|nr:hypothetical protein [Actinoplanes rectilineatus]